MIKKEEKAQQDFEELKDILRKLSPRWWRNDFKSCIDRFIKEQLDEKESIIAMSCEDDEDEELVDIYIHGIRRLMAGAIQEWELVQQPKHATTCAKIDGALVWQGRGYVSPILHAISLLQPSLQSQFEKVSPALWLVMLKPFTRFTFPLCRL
jgi:hypothetical protein